MVVEIEKKYLVDHVNLNTDGLAYKLIGDVYFNQHIRFRMSVSPRSLNVEYYITVKFGKGEIRIEFEVQISKKIFDIFVDKDRGALWKRRYPFPCGLSIDYYQPDNMPIIIEIEGKDYDDADFFAQLTCNCNIEDVTNNEQYRGYNLFKKKLTISRKKSII